MTFRQAVKKTPGIANAYRPGLQALRSRDRQRISVKNTRRISGSVDLDSALQSQFPNDPRWDYGVGYRGVNSQRETVYWIEIHPANSREINTVLKKLHWLKDWLQQYAPDLNRMKKDFFWISSGKTTLSPTAPRMKKLAEAGLRQLVGSRLCIE